MRESKDWQKWHTLYDNSKSGQAKRLKLVQESIGDSLPDSLNKKYQIIDVCSGDGRDLLGALERYHAKNQVHSYLVEIDGRLAKESEDTASDKNLQNVTVFNGDASSLSIYRNVLPADLILLCGIFGNISDDDIRNTIESLPQLSKQGTKVIWTRHLRQPEAALAIQNLFVVNDFREINYKATDDGSYAVATYEFRGSPKQFNDSTRLFTFMK